MIAAARDPDQRAGWLAARRPGGATRIAAASVLAVALALAGCSAQPRPGRPPATVTAMTGISSRCPGGSEEAEAASAAPAYVYATWIGCGGIGVARSADGGRHFGRPVTVPGSAAHSWDPAVAVAPDGTLYVAYMHMDGALRQPGTRMYPVVAVSTDHGASFSRVTPVLPPAAGNWGDRDFIAAGPAGTVYLTWDYGPSASAVRLLCSHGGSCAYANGDLNAVTQKSGDGGRTWGPVTHLEPGFPLGGGYGAPLVVRTSGRVDVLYSGHPTDPGTLTVHPGYEYFTSAPGGTGWPAHPQPLWPGAGLLSLSEWWIDGDLAADTAGNLYATWDTQTAKGDIGWLTWSRDGGRHWSQPARVTPGAGSTPRIVEVAAGRPGIAYVAWQTAAGAPGYGTYLRPYSVSKGWLGPVIRVSSRYGKATVWPGDTFGIAVLPGTRTRIFLTWGSAVGHHADSGIYAAVATLPPGE